MARLTSAWVLTVLVLSTSDAEGVSVLVRDLQMGFRFNGGTLTESSQVTEVIVSLSPAEVKERHCR